MNAARPRVPRIVALAAILALTVSCAGQAPAAAPAAPVVQATAAPAAAAPVVAATSAPASAAPQALLAHKAGTKHELMPKRIETVIEIDMGDHYFASTTGAKNPTFTLPVGKVIGLHFHNDGSVMHEFEIGQAYKKDGGYEKSLFDLVEADVFFYYPGGVKAEVGGATFEEIEIEQGIQDVWIRFTVPAELKGEWEIGCFAPEHYEKGMKAKVVIQ